MDGRTLFVQSGAGMALIMMAMGCRQAGSNRQATAEPAYTTPSATSALPPSPAEYNPGPALRPPPAPSAEEEIPLPPAPTFTPAESFPPGAQRLDSLRTGHSRPILVQTPAPVPAPFSSATEVFSQDRPEEILMEDESEEELELEESDSDTFLPPMPTTALSPTSLRQEPAILPPEPLRIEPVPVRPVSAPSRQVPAMTAFTRTSYPLIEQWPSNGPCRSVTINPGVVGSGIHADR